ncbi:MAG: TolC family protein [Cyclobacteriaceae bacterium]|jgi:heavy metal efflux system protein|nr:TolC family protein [Cyclobacteriaceae bacterium]
MKKYFLATLFLLMTLIGKSQQLLTLEQAIESALQKNEGVQAASYNIESQKALKKTGFDLPKTNVSLLYGQYNSYAKNDNNLTVTQTIPFTVFGSQGALNRSLVASSELKKAATENELIFQVKQVYYQLAFLRAKQKLLEQQDSIYGGFLKAASLRYKTGEANLLEQATAESQRNEVRNLLSKNQADQLVIRNQLKTLINSEELPDITDAELNQISFSNTPDSVAVQANPSARYMQQQMQVAKNEKKVEAAKAAPEVMLGFFTQTLIGIQDTESGSGAIASSSDRFTGFQVGLSIPLWFVPQQGRVKAAEYNRQAAESNYHYYHKTLQGQYQQAMQEYTKNKNSLEYYTTSALPNAELILKQTLLAFSNGEIGYAEYLLGVQKAIAIKEGHLQTLNDYNQSIIYIEFLSGNK